jgi:eukaryotic-like serine/threonine-protein kinase
MGKENSTPRSDPENPKKWVDSGGAHTGAAGPSARGETTLDTGGRGSETEGMAEDRVSIGPYVLVKKLGEGGMGQVWLAEQTVPVRRQVALKLVKGGLYDSAVIQRFEAERQSLAVMNHPAIAKVFDAGSTADGQPYFVMEYVPGLPITRYCDEKKLKVRERLELLIKVCEGVQHAHQKAIMHRDLKPSNILVVEVDGKATPRIIDFGIAKAISSKAGGDQTMFTQVGALIGTPGFMSPEQADPSVLDVDTRTDVYSLGVVLYVLLTGMLPFDSEGGKKKPIDGLLRQLREEDPPSPSTKVNAEKETGAAAAERRGTEAKQLVKLLRGDLDWITMKAVEKERARRYGTPSELAADIERYLENRPVVARPASAGYRLKKYVQRHRVGVAVAAGAVGLLVAFAVMQGAQLRRITRERDRANRIADFMTSMFKVSDPSEARGNNITAREILDKASKDIDTGLAKDPELQAQMMKVMGNVFDSLGLYPQGEQLYQRVLDIQRREIGPERRETLETMSNLAKNWMRQGRYSEAQELYVETLGKQLRALGSENQDVLRTKSDMAAVLRNQGRYNEAEKLYTEAFDGLRRSLGPEHPDTLLTMNNLAMTLEQEGRSGEAERLERETLDLQRSVLGPEHPSTLLTMNALSWTLTHEGRYAETEKLQRDTLEIQRRILGPEHPDTLLSMDNLANTLVHEGRFAEGEKLQRETLEILRRVRGPEHPNTLTSMNDLANTLADEGRYAETEKLQRETLAIQQRIMGPEHPDTLLSMNNLSDTLVHEGRFAEGEKLQRETLAIQRRTLGPDHPDTAVSTYNLGSIAAHRGQRDEAFSLLREAVDHGLRPEFDLGIEQDPDLKSLHGDPRFAALVVHAKERAAATHKPN